MNIFLHVPVVSYVNSLNGGTRFNVLKTVMNYLILIFPRIVADVLYSVENPNA